MLLVIHIRAVNKAVHSNSYSYFYTEPLLLIKVYSAVSHVQLNIPLAL